MARQNIGGVVVTPATWPQKVETLSQTPSGLFNAVGWFGSTHASAMWRKAPEFLAVFKDRGVFGFDPQIDDWDPSFATVEAEVLASAAVIIIRLENHELHNGSLGSIAETGLALTSAALRGQIIVVSIEDDLLSSLDDPGAIAQLIMLEMFLEEVEQNDILSHFCQVHRGNDLHSLAHLACDLAQHQKKSPVAGLGFDDYLAKKNKRQQNFPLRVLLGGSGGTYAKVYQPRFEQKKQRLLAPYQAQPEFVVKDLSAGAIADAWNIPYDSRDESHGVALAMRTLLAIELERKQDADLLILAIMAEAASKAGATGIGVSLLQALTSGQAIQVYLEPFDPVDFIHQQFTAIRLTDNPDERTVREILRTAGVSDYLLATAVQEEVFATFDIFKALHEGNSVAFKTVKTSLLAKTKAFHNADNIRRVRVLVEAHLDKLSSDERFPNFFEYHKEIKLGDEGTGN
ncbi:MAG: hypothetical protein R3264_11055 [Anaerolineae bacterium]|nr:hypothetical protein [Anaerolineae bacterium]